MKNKFLGVIRIKFSIPNYLFSERIGGNFLPGVSNDVIMARKDVFIPIKQQCINMILTYSYNIFAYHIYISTIIWKRHSLTRHHYIFYNH